MEIVANLHGTVAALNRARGAGRASTSTSGRRGGRSDRDRLGRAWQAASTSGQISGHGGREEGERHGEAEGEDSLGVHDARGGDAAAGEAAVVTSLAGVLELKNDAPRRWPFIRRPYSSVPRCYL